MNTSFSSIHVQFIGHLDIIQHLDVLKGHLFLICKKIPLSSKEEDLIIISFNNLSAIFLILELILEKSHCFSNTAEWDLIILSKIEKKCFPRRDLTLTPCHSPSLNVLLLVIHYFCIIKLFLINSFLEEKYGKSLGQRKKEFYPTSTSP